MRKKPAIHRIAVLALPRVVAFDLAIPMQVFGHPDQSTRYEVTLCAPEPGDVLTTSGFPIGVGHGLGVLGAVDTVLVPGFSLDIAVPATALRALADAARRGARIASICTGAFALAEAGLLDGRRATTHWQHCADLARRFPAVTVDPRVLYVDEGPVDEGPVDEGPVDEGPVDEGSVLTSAGIAAGLDLCLHILQRDHGEDAAVAVARRMVMPLHRAGGQAQFIPPGWDASGDESADLSATLRWAGERLDEPLTVAAMARHAVRSPRSFHRAFRAQTGASPHDWLTRQRLRTACALLEDPRVSVEEVARRSGLGTAANLRLHFQRAFATTPTAYRSTFVG